MNNKLTSLEDTSERIVFVGDTPVDRERYYTPEQVEKILGVQRVSIDRRVRAGLLKRSGTARNIFYKGQHIIDYLDNK